MELHRNPGLRGKPVVVGGNPNGRGVVATASYEARRYGIRSAMSSAEARRRCPQVVFVRPDHKTYREWSRGVWALVHQMAPVVEQVGIDEGYLVLPDGDPREQAELVQLAVRERMRLSCSLGVATCKVVAKIASDARKPGGITVVPRGGEAAFLAGLAVRTLPGVGPKAEVRLVAAGVATIGALAELDDAKLAELLPGARRRRAAAARPGDRSPPGERRARRGHLDLERGDVRRRRARPRGALRPPAAHGGGHRRGARAARHERADRHDEGALPRLRDRDAVAQHRRSASTTPRRSRDLACSLLDRALRHRPGPIRLVGVGVSGLDRHRQLSLPVAEDEPATP